MRKSSIIRWGILMAGLVLASVGYGFSPLTDCGDFMLALAADLEGEITAPSVKAFYGIPLLRGLQAGPQGSWVHYSGTSLAQVGLHLERTTDLNKTLLPYLGGGISYGEVRGGDDDNKGVILHGEMGVKGIASEAFGWSISLVGEHANKSMFGPDDDTRRNSLSLQIALRYFL